MSTAYPVDVEHDGAVAVVTLNRPERHNALVPGAQPAIQQALREASRGSRVVVLRGAGPSFCSGHDLGVEPGGRADSVEGTYQALRAGVDTIRLMREIPQPVVVALQGHVIGAGFSLAAAADIRIAAPSTTFSAMFTGIGLSAGDLGLSWFLPRLIGTAASAELFYRAGEMTAAEAEGRGMVSRVVERPAGDALRVAHEIAAQAPFAVRRTKELLNASLGLTGFREHLELELRTQLLCLLTEDHAEARAARRENRAPEFRGR